VEISSEFSILELKKAVGVGFGKVFNESFDNFIIKTKDND
jgi:hypothetical protein